MRCRIVIAILLSVAMLSGCGAREEDITEDAVKKEEQTAPAKKIPDNAEYEAIIENNGDKSRDFIIFEGDRISLGNEHGETFIVQKGVCDIETAEDGRVLLNSLMGDTADAYASELLDYVNGDMEGGFVSEEKFAPSDFVCGICSLNEEVARGGDGKLYGTSYAEDDLKKVILMGYLCDESFCGGWCDLSNEEAELQLPVLKYKPKAVETFNYQIIEKE